MREHVLNCMGIILARHSYNPNLELQMHANH